ncbi:hypothetical protein [Dyadobacter sp. CY312]|uniref:hypothetical protein n=1 Tax=Dyadobacter sp. CY312 TaxID=2907303 RepID=UPI001F2A14CB|nr:hypothetical protein [Dyadobacter sp. CY312]MCE7039158.1 hypothetical protein [Dyadobacter sp. CY312]
MNKRISSLLLLLLVSVTDAYLLSHPNLIGRLGILVYKHVYIKNFSSSLMTVFLVVGVSLLICEVIRHFTAVKVQIICFSLLLIVSLAWLAYVYNTFSTFSYRITGKAFIYGAHLLPVILGGMYGRFLVKAFIDNFNRPKESSAEVKL